MIRRHVCLDVIKYVVINYILNNIKNMCKFFYCINVGLCIKTIGKIDAYGLMLRWQSMKKWNVTLILTNLLFDDTWHI